MKLKKGDTVKVVKGKDKGRTGKIEKVFPQEAKVLIPGINVYKKSTKPRSEKEPGGIIDIVKALPVAKVALVCPKCGQPTRIGYQVDKKGGPPARFDESRRAGETDKARICRKCKAVI